MCRQNSCMHLSEGEAIAAEESLLIFCKPVELYNILHRRAQQNPSYLQRCLDYKIQSRRRRRLQMTFSLLGTIKEGVQAHNLLPLYILLAKPLSDTVVAGEQHSAVYRLSRACRLTSFVEFDGRRQAEANLILPEINKLSLDVKAGKLTILLVSCGETKNSLCEEIFCMPDLQRIGQNGIFGIPFMRMSASWFLIVTYGVQFIHAVNFYLKCPSTSNMFSAVMPDQSMCNADGPLFSKCNLIGPSELQQSYFERNFNNNYSYIP